MFSTVLLCSDLCPFPKVWYNQAWASVAASTPSSLSLCSEQNMSTLSNSALYHKLGVLLLPIYLKPLSVENNKILVAPSEVLKVNMGRGQAGHFQTAWHNKWKCPISASRHEVYFCHWCHQIKSAHKSQSDQSLVSLLIIQELQSHLLVLLVLIGTILRHLATILTSPETVRRMFIQIKLVNFAFVIATLRRKMKQVGNHIHLWKIMSKLIK